MAFAAYMGVALWLALRARGEERGDAFWTAGRDLGPGSVGLSISAGFLSISWSCVYAVQLFHWYGLGAVWLVTIPWLLALAGIYVLARRYNELPAFSQPEMVRARFGGAAAKLVAGALAFVFLVWGGAEIHVAGGLLAPGMGISQESVVLLIGLGVGAYATLGGFRAVIDTDKVQYAVVVLYIGAVAWLALRGLSSLEGGIGAVFADPPEASRTGRPWTSLLGPGIATIVLTLVAYLPGWLFETDLWLRVQAARSPRAARRGVLIAGINGALFVGALPLLIGVAALALFPASADGTLSPAVGEEGEAIFTALVAHYGPGWLAVPVAVGLLAAAMSTIDTCVNVVALSVAYDFGGAGSMPEERAARFSRWITAGSVLAATVFALAIDSLWDAFYLASGVLTVAVAFPVAAVLLPWVRRRAVLISTSAGLVTLLAAYVGESSGALAALEPTWLIETEVGYVLWGGAAAFLGAVIGQRWKRKLQR